jgi:hypothetical protein
VMRAPAAPTDCSTTRVPAHLAGAGSGPPSCRVGPHRHCNLRNSRHA